MTRSFTSAKPESKPDLADLFRAALLGHLDELYAQPGMQAKNHWPWGKVHVWATAPGADLLRCRWTSDGGLDCRVPEHPDLESLALDPKKKYLQTESGWWLPLRGRGLMLSALYLEAAST